MVKEYVVGITVGAAVGSTFLRTFDTAEKRAKRLGEQWDQTNKKLSAAGDVVKYRDRGTRRTTVRALRKNGRAARRDGNQGKSPA